MLTRFVCLANSVKEGGRCLAGITLDPQHNPVIADGRPKWIRPVCHHTPHGEVPVPITQSITLLHIIELDVIAPHPQGYQCENVTFNERSICVVGNMVSHQLHTLCDTKPLIFDNNGKAVSEANIDKLTHSLLLVSVTTFEVVKRIYETRPDKPQLRLVFTYNGHQYDLPITDPAFRHNYYQNPELLRDVAQIFLCLSLGIAWENWHHKLVAGIIY